MSTLPTTTLLEHPAATPCSQPPHAPEPSRKELIELPGERTSISDCARNLFRFLQTTNRFFRRGDTVVHVEQRGNRFQLRPLTPVAALSCFDQYVTFVELIIAQGRGLPKIISEQQAKTLLASEEVYRLSEIAAVVSSPILLRRGDAISLVQNGYNGESQIFVDSICEVPPIPLAEAVHRLLFILREYQFFEEADRSRAIASLITPALKLGGFLPEPTPIDVAEADLSQAGKSYRQKLVAAVYNSEMSVITNQKGGVGSLDENIAQALAEGKTFIQIDNVRQKLNSQRLEAIITADQPMAMRIPNVGHVSIDPRKYSFFISSNKFEPTPDLANRSSIIRIRKRERVAFTRYPEGDLLAHIRANYLYFLSGVHAVIRHWWEQGHPQTNETRHDMRQWCQILDWIVQNIFALPPLMEGHDEAKARTTNPYLGFLRTMAFAVQQSGNLEKPLTATGLSDICAVAGEAIPGLREDLQGDTDQRKRRLGTILGTIFTDSQEARVEGFLVRKDDQRVETAGGNAQTLHYYTFFAPAAGC